MKKILLVAALILFNIQTYAQQTQFGITAGYLNINVTSSAASYDESQNAGGFYAGLLVDIALSEAFYVQPSVIYGNADDSNLLSIPILAKYYVANSGFNLMAGPQATIILDQLPGYIKALGMDLGFGLGYDFNENIFLQTKYFREITNRASNAIEGTPSGIDFKSSVNTLFVGLGYKF